MTTANIDILDGQITATEIAGQVTAVTREALLAWEDDKAIEDALTYALQHETVPQPGDTLTINGQTVWVESRTPTLIDKRKVRVTVQYKRQEFTDDDDPGNSDITYSGGTALAQIETQLDLSGEQITVAHNGVTQGGSVGVLAPQSTLRAEVVIAIASPGVISIMWGGFLNSSLWNGGAPDTWLCQSVTFEPVDMLADVPKWRFIFEFQYERDGWQPQVVFIDPETGEPPPGLIEGEGYKTVTEYPAIDFATRFPG